MISPVDETDDAPATTKRRGTAENVRETMTDAKGHSGASATVTINRRREELYAFWRDLSNLPKFMDNVEAVGAIDDTRSHWRVKAPAGRTVEWDARLTEDVANEVLAWTSEPGADVENSGRIVFKDAGERGTIVQATVLYDPPAGVVGKIVAKMFQREPAIQARRDLRRFKQLMETGEIATAANTRAAADEEKD